MSLKEHWQLIGSTNTRSYNGDRDVTRKSFVDPASTCKQENNQHSTHCSAAVNCTQLIAVPQHSKSGSWLILHTKPRKHTNFQLNCQPFATHSLQLTEVLPQLTYGSSHSIHCSANTELKAAPTQHSLIWRRSLPSFHATSSAPGSWSPNAKTLTKHQQNQDWTLNHQTFSRIVTF